MKNLNESAFSCRFASAVVAALFLVAAAGSASAQSGNASATSPGALNVATAGQSVTIEQAEVDGNLLLSGEGARVIVAPGVHAVKGDFVVSGDDASVVVVFNDKKQYGILNISGKLDIAADSAATLALDLGNARLVRGEKLILFSASEVTGTFNGMDDGQEFDVDGCVLKIGYSAQSVWVTVVKGRRRGFARAPIIEINADLIDPTSTGPSTF